MKVLSMLAAAAALSCSAFGAQVVQSQNVSTTALDFTRALTFNAFDPTLGTLNDIQFQISASTADTIVFTNTSGRSRTFTTASSVDALFGTAGIVVYTETIPSSTSSQSVANGQTVTVNGNASGNATAVYNGTTGALASYTSSNGSANGNPTNPITVATFVGAGKTFTYNFDASNNSTVAGGSNTSTTSGTASGNVTVIYDYTAGTTSTPEPATMGLLGSALVGLGFLKFRTKKN